MLVKYLGRSPEVIPSLGGRTVQPGRIYNMPDVRAVALLGLERWERVTGAERKSGARRPAKSRAKSETHKTDGVDLNNDN